MKKKIIGILAAGCMLLAFSTTASAQKKITVKVESQKVDATRGSNPNIKSEAPTTDAPESKSRGTCMIDFTNYTGYYINVYVDGYYKGQLSPYGKGTVYVGDGYTTIYGLSAGGTVEWPTKGGNCSGYYTYGFY
jgi:hypothetical protein